MCLYNFLFYLAMSVSDEIESVIPLFTTQQGSASNKKVRIKKESFLLKFQLFTLIYQKRGQQNFNYIVNNIRIVEYGFASEIFRDAKDRSFTYIISGLVLVFVQKADDPISAPILYRKMGANEHFGEKMMYSANLKLHSAKSVSKTYVLQLDLQTFYKTFSGHFKYQQLKEKVQFLKSIWLFKEISLSEIERILLLSKPYRYSKNTVLFKQGEQPEAVFIVVDGELTLFKKNKQKAGKYLPFMILTKGELCGFQEIVSSTPNNCSGVITTSDAVLLKISSKLFLDIFSDKINSSMIIQRTVLKEKLIEVKSKKSISHSLKKLNQAQKQKGQGFKRKRNRYKSQSCASVLGDIFDIKQTSISWQNCLKNKKLKEFMLKDRVSRQKKESNSMRISAATNNCFTNDKQLLLSYMIRKQKQEKKEQVWQQNFRRRTIYGNGELVVTDSSAVKNHKRKIKQSRKRNISSMPILI